MTQLQETYYVHKSPPESMPPSPAPSRPIGAEDAAELIQDTIAHAAAMLHRAEAAGKKVAASTVAYFAVKLTKSGRRSTGSGTTDVLHPGTQLSGRARVVSFDEPLGIDEAWRIHHAGRCVRQSAGRSLHAGGPEPGLGDVLWQANAPGSKVIGGGGRRLHVRHGARLLGLSDSAIQGEKRKLALAWLSSWAPTSWPIGRRWAGAWRGSGFTTRGRTAWRI
jgi:hypothetical protein